MSVMAQASPAFLPFSRAHCSFAPSIWRSTLTQEFLQEVVRALTKLEWISLFGKQITDDSLDHLKGLKNLKKLVLRATSVTKEGELKLKQALPGVEIVRDWE